MQGHGPRSCMAGPQSPWAVNTCYPYGKGDMTPGLAQRCQVLHQKPPQPKPRGVGLRPSRTVRAGLLPQRVWKGGVETGKAILNG